MAEPKATKSGVAKVLPVVALIVLALGAWYKVHRSGGLKILWNDLLLGTPTARATSYAPRAARPSPAVKEKLKDTVVITDEWYSPEIDFSRRPIWNVDANLLRKDLWHYVEVNGGNAAGGIEFEAPPWGQWAELGWSPPNFTFQIHSYRVRLVPEKNGGVHEAQWTWWIKPQ